MKIIFPSQTRFPGLLASAVLAAVALLASAADARAGSFGGPPPFRNGSPLVSGVDGSYQAIARATNITGIFRFQYANGIQTATSANNSWVFFVEGRPQRGGVTAAINESTIAGVLDAGSANFATNSNGAVSLPLIIQSQSAQSVGEYNGKLQLKDPYGTFSGTGKLNPSPAQTNQITIVSQGNSTGIGSGVVYVTNVFITNGIGTGTTNGFRFRGVRTSVTTQPITSGTNNTN